jgi:signal transduction histidine kinase
MRAFSAKQTRQRLGILFSLPFVFCLIFFFLQVESEKTDIRLLQIQNIEADVNRLPSLAKDAESSERGFLLTGDLALLRPFRAAKLELSNINGDRKELGALSSNMKELIKLVGERLRETDDVLKAQREEGFEEAMATTARLGSADKMNQVQLLASSLRTRLNSLQTDILSHQHTLNQLAMVSFAIGTLAMIGVMYWLYNEVLNYLYERDLAQQQLERFNADLQRMVDERTHELVEANRELQQFAYVASHDLQEPLRTITSFSQLLASRYKDQLDGDGDEFIGYIVTSARRMTDLIDGLLHIAGLRKQPKATTRVSFDKLLDDAEVGLQASIRQHDVTIERGPMPDLAVDRVQMLQVFQNLISNAIKYRRDEPPVIRVTATRSGNEWKFSVADNGCGFNQEFAERIFGLFQRLHARDVSGTGLGLSITRRIVERHGGRIWAESKEGRGSTFFFTLPIGLEAAKSNGAPKPVEAGNEDLTPQARKARA